MDPYLDPDPKVGLVKDISFEPAVARASGTSREIWAKFADPQGFAEDNRLMILTLSSLLTRGLHREFISQLFGLW